MDRRRARCRLGMALIAFTIPPAATEAQTETPAPIVLHVTGTSALPPDVVDRASRVVTRIYSAADTRVVWRSAGRDAPVDAGGLQLLVIIRVKGKEIPRSVLGFAPNPGRAAYVIYDHVETFARVNLLDVGHALGHVIAHEVGHLLLPPNAHSTTGLMCGILDSKVLRLMPDSEIGFTASQATQIRARLSAADGL